VGRPLVAAGKDGGIQRQGAKQPSHPLPITQSLEPTDQSPPPTSYCPSRTGLGNGGENVAARRWKLASYEVAGNLSGCLFVLKGRWIPPSRKDGFLLGEAQDTMFLANFRLSLWDELPPLREGNTLWRKTIAGRKV
jgi:hypothetical protein